MGGAVAGTTIGAHAARPDLRNRILRIKDGADNDLEIHQVYIPLFDSEGFSDPNLNGIGCGGFWIDKYQACHARRRTNVSRGSSTVTIPAPTAPPPNPGCHLDRHQLDNAKIAIENRGGSGNKKMGHLCRRSAPVAHQSSTVAAITDLIGRRVRITQGGVTSVAPYRQDAAATRTRTQTPRNSSRSTRHSR